MSKPMLLSDRVPVPPSAQASVVEGLSIAIDAVAARAAPSHRFLRYGWYAAALSAYGGRAKTLVVEEDGVAAIALPFVALGRNALLVYFGVHTVVMVMSALPRDQESWTSRISSTIGIAGYDQYTWTGLSLVLWIGLCLWLHRRGLYLRA